VLGRDCWGFCKWGWHRCWRWMCLWYLLSSLNRGELCACKFRFSKPFWAPITLRQKSDTWWCRNTDRALVGIHVVWQCPLLHMSCAKRFEIISGSYSQIRWRNNSQATESNHMHMDMLKSQRWKRKCLFVLWRAQIKPEWDSTTPKCYWSDPLMAKNWWLSCDRMNWCIVAKFFFKMDLRWCTDNVWTVRFSNSSLHLQLLLHADLELTLTTISCFGYFWF
jgi:hypothetical protein